ncbi:MAG: complex I subunit 5 family protein [Pseudomonadota bacterium]
MTGAGMQAWILPLIPAVPLVMACGLLIWPRQRFLIAFAPWAALSGLICSVAVTPSLALDLPWLLLGARLGIDQTAQVFLAFTSLLWLTAGVFATGSLKDDENKTRFFIFFLLAMAGNLGLVVAQDMLSFYVFFALMSFSSYGLIVHSRTAEAQRAGRVYIIMVVAGELLLFAALVMAAQAAGSVLFADVRPTLANAPTQNWIVVLALTGFGIKLGVLGLHVWLPLAHPVAPTPASAVLSGAMIKAGLLGWLKLLPLGADTMPIEWSVLLMGVGVLAVFYAAVVGVTQQNPKTVLAYSSVSQMGLVTVAVGLGIALPQRWPEILATILFLALHHALAKSALFLGVGVARSHLTTKWHRWCVALGLVLPALALAGAPFTGGSLVKELLGAEAGFLLAPWSNTLKLLLSWSVVATVLLMARFLYLTWPRAAAADTPATYSMSIPWAVLIATLLLAPFYAGPDSADLVWSLSTVLSSLSTLALAIAGTVVGAWIFAKISRHRLPLPPAGDLVVVAEWATCFVLKAVDHAVRHLDRRQRRGATQIKAGWARLRWPLAFDYAMDLAWSTASLLFLLMGLVFILAIAI